MCEFSGKLIAWLDRELPAEEATEVEGHLEACSKCRIDVDTYKRASNEFDAYYDEVIASGARRGAPGLVPVVLAAGAVAALVALFLVWPRIPVEPPAFPLPQVAVAAPAGAVAATVPAPVSSLRKVRPRRVAAPVQIQNANTAPAQGTDAYYLPNEPVIQIAIPADEIFPPGAVPEGMHFAADLTIAADGSAERLRLRPRLAGFERRTTQP